MLGKSQPTLQKGDIAPPFSLQAHDGSEVSLEQYLGKHVVIWFYPVASTPG